MYVDWSNFMDMCKLLNQNLFAGHVYVVVAPKKNEEEIEYWLACCVETKHKLIAPQEDDDGFPYPTGLVIPFRHPLKQILITIL